MQYYLSGQRLSKTEIVISKEDFDSLVYASNVIQSAFHVEEIYDILVTNYIYFEKEIAFSAIENNTQLNFRYSKLYELRKTTNLLLINLLSAARLYLDILPKIIKSIFPDNHQKEQELKKFISNQYDESKFYRFMEALRNYVQHRGLPIHQTSHGFRKMSLEVNSLSEFNIQIFSSKSYFENDKKFKKIVLKEFGDKINIIESVRHYVESLSAIQFEFRKLTNVKVENSRNTIKDKQDIIKSRDSGDVFGYYAVKILDTGEQQEIQLGLDWDNVRIDLQKKNRQLKNLSRSYYTNKIIK